MLGDIVFLRKHCFNFDLIGRPTAELDALERLKKKKPKAYNGKNPLFTAVLDQILFIFAGNDNIHGSLDEFEIRPDPTTGFHGNRQGYDGKKTVSSLFLGCFSSVPFHTCR